MTAADMYDSMQRSASKIYTKVLHCGGSTFEPLYEAVFLNEPLLALNEMELDILFNYTGAPEPDFRTLGPNPYTIPGRFFHREHVHDYGDLKIETLRGFAVAAREFRRKYDSPLLRQAHASEYTQALQEALQLILAKRKQLTEALFLASAPLRPLPKSSDYDLTSRLLRIKLGHDSLAPLAKAIYRESGWKLARQGGGVVQLPVQFAMDYLGTDSGSDGRDVLTVPASIENADKWIRWAEKRAPTLEMLFAADLNWQRGYGADNGVAGYIQMTSTAIAIRALKITFKGDNEQFCYVWIIQCVGDQRRDCRPVSQGEYVR